LKEDPKGSTENYVFCGYPSGNFLKQICIVISLWNQAHRFPIRFEEIESLKEHDETEHYVQSFEKFTPYICEIFK